jgi:hypothetical protein
MSDIYDQSYNNPYHINRHSLGDQYRINLQNAPQNTSWFTGGSPSHNQRNGSILRDNGRFVIPSTYNQPRSQSYNKYNSKISETEYNSEYVPYSPEYYQPIKGLGRRLDIDRKQPFREEKINNGSYGEYGKYDIPPALMKKLKMLEKEYDSKLKTFTFRYKDGKRTQNVKASFENNKEYIGLCKNDIFYKIFFKNIGYRESCYNCEFSKIKRVSDITVGDFWGIEKSIPNFDDKYGVSLLLNNTDKAMEIFNKIKDKFDIVKSNIDDCLQPNLISPTPKGYKNEIFWEEFRKNGLEKGGELLDE